MDDAARTPSVAVLTPFAGNPAARTSQLAALVPYGPPAAKKAKSSQIVALEPHVSEDNELVPRTTQIVVLVVYKTGGPDDFTPRAWTFDLDGHSFYVLSLGKRGTFVYDITTDQWSKWETSGYDGIWNMERGITWENTTIAADSLNPNIWRLDPHSGLDENFRPMTREVTGLINHRDRNWLPNYAARITASLGEPDDPLTATLSFSFSDDGGHTFSTPIMTTITQDDFTQDLEFRNLGSIRKPGRVYSIVDTGALTRIDGADVDILGLE